MARDGNGTYHVERHVDEFLMDLVNQGCSVTFLQGMQKLVANLSFFGGTLPRGTMDIVGVQAKNPLSLLANAPAIARAVLRADFVYLFFPGSHSRLIGRLCRMLGKPYGLYLRAGFGDKSGDAPLVRDASALLSVSPSFLEDLPDAPPNAGLIRPMCGITREDAFDRSFQAIEDRPVRLLFVGRVAPIKGVPELVEAMDILRATGLRFVLTIVGGGPLHDELAERFADSAGPVRIAGTISDRRQLLDLYEANDIFILPTHHEGFPRVLYEAMIKTLPIVTTMVDGIPAIMAADRNCLAIPVGDPAAIADAVRKLATDPQLARRLAQNGISTVIDILENRQPHAAALLSRLPAGADTRS